MLGVGEVDVACLIKTEDIMMRSLRSCAAALFAFGVVASTIVPPASAQTYPTKPVQLVVAFPPGGVGDIVARAVSDKLAGALAAARQRREPAWLGGRGGDPERHACRTRRLYSARWSDDGNRREQDPGG